MASSVASLCGEIAPSSDSPLHSKLCKKFEPFPEEWIIFPVLVRFSLISV